MSLRGNPDDTRYVEKIKQNFELIDVVKDSGEIYPIADIAVDAESEELGLVYKSGKAEVIPFDEFPDGEIGLILEPRRIESING